MNLKKLTVIAGLCVLASACDMEKLAKSNQEDSNESNAQLTKSAQLSEPVVTKDSCFTITSDDPAYTLIDSFNHKVVKSLNSKVKFSSKTVGRGKAVKTAEKVNVVTENIEVKIYKDYAGLVLAQGSLESTTEKQVSEIVSEKAATGEAIVTCLTSENEEFTYSRSALLEKVSIEVFGNSKGETIMDKFKGNLAGKGVLVKIENFATSDETTEELEGDLKVEYSSQDSSDEIFSKKSEDKATKL